MKNLTYVTIGVIIFITSFIINFNDPFLLILIGKSTFLTIFVLLLVRILFNVKEKKSNKIVNFLFIFVTLFIGLFLLIWFGELCPANIYAYFAHNIFTGECKILTGGGCNYKPWYYQYDCPSEKKVAIFKNTVNYQGWMKACTSWCENENKNEFCQRYDYRFGPNGIDAIDCNLIVKCDKFNCF
ncbi:MAG: hypothetical protein AABX33_05820 [Nanoarchaeota archaeon]